MTTQYFVPPAQIVNGRVLVKGEEARHLVKVLRARAGDIVQVVDGEGSTYDVQLTLLNVEQSEGHILSRKINHREPTYSLSMAVGLLKNAKRYEIFLEKAVELGVSHIIPLITERTEKKGIRPERAQSILIAALKQCGRSRLPTIEDPTTLNQLLKKSQNENRFVCHEAKDERRHLLDVCSGMKRDVPITVFIGSEGGFSEGELAKMEESGIIRVTLGPRRFRTETAAIVAASIVMASIK